jgi:pSer/pThr/pTyr-binding forkhead associated (FHA) protein
MSPFGWGEVLFASKWVIIGLVYFALAVVLVAVRRELSFRIASREPEATGVAPGRLSVLGAGSDNRLRAGTVFELAPVTHLGAEPDNEIVLGDRFVSARHARLSWDGTAWWVEDLGSRNGTWINRRRLPPHQPEILPPGGVLQVGDASFELSV